MKKNKYSILSGDKLENHLNDYLISHWSVSALNSFRMNEKAFEKNYIYKDYSYKNTVTSTIGSIYHEVLETFFKKLKESNTIMKEEEMFTLGFKLLNKVDDDSITLPSKKTREEALDMILNGVKSTISNFYEEKEVYLELIDEILLVEEKLETFIILNGRDIELPVVARLDIVFRDKEGRVRILDHKTCGKYTKPEEINLKYSTQSIVYLKVVEAVLDEKVYAFHFFENKISKNRDGGKQIKGITILLDESSQKFYEAFIYEPLHKMIGAVKDPNYVYTINPNDFFTDSGEMLEFWNKTRVGFDFKNLTKNQKKILEAKEITDDAFEIPDTSALEVLEHKDNLLLLSNKQVMSLPNDKKIEYALMSQGLRAQVKHKIEGYSTDTYLLKVPPSTKITKIFKYELDISAILGVANVRIANNLSVYDGGVYVAVEVPRKERKYPAMSEALESCIIPLGVDNNGNSISWDLNSPYTPHMMLSGASGSGKSYLLNSAIQNTQGVEIHVLDPKREFKEYPNSLQELADIELFIEKKVEEMERIFKDGKKKTQLIIFDEASDCFARQSKIKGIKTLEDNVLLLSQKARSAGIHLLLAAQRFSVNVLKGDAQANFPVRLCLRVARPQDSMVMLGEIGAEKLLGNGDGLLQTPDLPNITRIQSYK